MRKNYKYYIIAIILLFIAILNYRGDDYYKKYVIDNIENGKFHSENTSYLDSLDGYYDTISISSSDSTYVIVCWGNRNSFWWNLRRDKIISCTILFKRFSGDNVDLDVKIIKEFNKIKKR